MRLISAGCDLRSSRSLESSEAFRLVAVTDGTRSRPMFGRKVMSTLKGNYEHDTC